MRSLNTINGTVQLRTITDAARSKRLRDAVATSGGSSGGSFIPGSHLHSIDDVVQLKTELEKRLLKSIFDDNFSVSDALVEVLKSQKINGNLLVTGGTTALADGAIQLMPSAAGGSEYLNDLLDVTITNPLIAQYLRWNGTNWVNASISYNDLIDKPSIPNVPSWALQASKPSYVWDEIGSKPELFPPSAHSHDYLPSGGKAVDSDLFDGVDSSEYWMRSRASVQEDHGYYSSSGSFVDVTNAGWTGAQWMFGCTGSTTGLNFRNPGGGNQDLQFRFSTDGNRWDGGFRNIWHSGNSNRSNADWVAKDVYSITIYSGATINCKTSLHGTEGTALSYASWTNYKWYDTSWQVGVRRNGDSSYNSFSISKNDDPYISITDRSMFFRNRTGIGCFADDNTTLAIGDSDTGFQSIIDGFVKGKANGIDVFGWTPNEFATYKPTTINSNATVTGNLLVHGGATTLSDNSFVLNRSSVQTFESPATYKQEQQQEALLMLSSDISVLRSENADLRRELAEIKAMLNNSNTVKNG